MILRIMFLKGDVAQQCHLKGMICPSNNSVSLSMRKDQKANNVCSVICTDHTFIFSNLSKELISDQSSIFKIPHLVPFLIPHKRPMLCSNLGFKSRKNGIAVFIKNNVK